MTTVENPFEKVRRKMVAARIEFHGTTGEIQQRGVAASACRGRMVAATTRLSPLCRRWSRSGADATGAERRQPARCRPKRDSAPHPRLRATRHAQLGTGRYGCPPRRNFSISLHVTCEAWERPFRHHAWGERKFYQLVNIVPMHDQAYAATGGDKEKIY